MRTERFLVNGLEVAAQFDSRDIDRIYIPLLQALADMQKQRSRRIVCFLAGPPASGKSTLCLFLERLGREMQLNVQSAGIDGFHYPQAYLDSHFIGDLPLARIKGAPETYDVAALDAHLAQVQGDIAFPIYDRRIHNPVQNALRITGDILILEGNWLLLDEKPWNALPCDYSVFLGLDDAAQLERIVRRKMAGGFSEADARRMVETNDRANILRCMENHRRADLNIRRGRDGLEVY